MKKTLIFSLLALTAACTKEPAGTPDGDTVRYTPRVGIAAEASAQTRGMVAGNDSRFRWKNWTLFLEADDTDSGSEYWALGYDNIAIRTVYQTGSADGTSGAPVVINYRYYTLRGGTEATLTQGNTNYGLPVFRSKGPVTFYGVHPAVAGFDPATTTAVPFAIGTTYATNEDYMCTGPVAVDPANAATLNAPLAFRHLMTLLEFRVSTSYVGTLRLQSIKLEASDGSGEHPMFYMAGAYDPRTGEVTGDAASLAPAFEMTFDKDVTYKANTSVTGSTALNYSSCPFIFPEYSPAVAAWSPDTRIKATFRFQYRAGESDPWTEVLTGPESELEFTLAQISAANGGVEGLVAGTHHIFNIEVDNFIKYSGYPEVVPWVQPDETDPNDDQTNDIIF